MLHHRIKYLDGIRIISSITVCFGHGAQTFLTPKIGSASKWIMISSYASSYSVIIFFLLSGFMVTNGIFNNYEKNGQFHVGKYWEERLLRLYPPLIFSIILCLIIYKAIMIFNLNGANGFYLNGDLGLAREIIQYSKNEMMDSLFFLQGFSNISMNMNGPLWSLGDEFVLYILASFFSIMLFNKKFILSLIGILIIVYFTYKSGHLKFALYLYSVWGLGALLKFENRGNFFKFSRVTFIVSAFVSFLIIGFLLNKLNFNFPPVDYTFSYFSILQISLIILIISIFKLISKKLRSIVKSIIEWVTPARDFTYTLYVIHFPLFLGIFSVLHPWLNKMNLMVSIFIGLSSIIVLIFIAMYLAKILENKAYAKRLYYFIKNN